MKCPKCGYLGFETGDRCRNCGYDFSFSVEPPDAPDLSLRTDSEPLGPLTDLKLFPAEASSPEVRHSPGGLDLDRLLGASPGPTTELPLFNGGGIDERPLVTPAVPRAPLAVRRATPEAPKLRTRADHVEAPTLDLEAPRPVSVPAARQASPAVARAAALPGGAVRRLAAAAIDAAILGAIHAAVLYFTLRLTQLPAAAISTLPWAPLGAFLLLLTAGYLVVFTVVGGQTIGKMAAGLRVAVNEGPVDVSHAVVRFLATGVTLLTLGIGYLPALFGNNRRALHDRIAGTDVVRG